MKQMYGRILLRYATNNRIPNLTSTDGSAGIVKFMTISSESDANLKT